MAKALERQMRYLDDPRTSIVHAAHEVDWKILKNAADVIYTKKNRVSTGKMKQTLTRTCRKAPNEDNHLSGSTGAYVILCSNMNAAAKSLRTFTVC